VVVKVVVAVAASLFVHGGDGCDGCDNFDGNHGG